MTIVDENLIRQNIHLIGVFDSSIELNLHFQNFMLFNNGLNGSFHDAYINSFYCNKFCSYCHDTRLLSHP